MSNESTELKLSGKTEAKTVDQAAAEKNKSRELEQTLADKKREAIAKMKEDIAAMQKEIEMEEKALKKSRNAVRTHSLIVLAADLISVFGFNDKEAACATKDEYQALRNTIIRKARRLMGQPYEMTYNELVSAFGLQKVADNCVVPEDFLNLNKSIMDKVKKLMAEDADARKNAGGNNDGSGNKG